tara:strand:- start:3222 stop:3626 length:405 start_codon:yes stop_codon:yes gene_type:complete
MEILIILLIVLVVVVVKSGNKPDYNEQVHTQGSALGNRGDMTWSYIHQKYVPTVHYDPDAECDAENGWGEWAEDYEEEDEGEKLPFMVVAQQAADIQGISLAKWLEPYGLYEAALIAEADELGITVDELMESKL